MKDHEHLSPELISAYLAREASPEERRQVLQHLLTCPACRLDVGEARELGTDRRPRRWAAYAIPAAAAAAVLFLLMPSQPETPPAVAVRGAGGEGVRQFAAVAPVNGTEVPGDGIVFVWRSDGTGTQYILTVTDAKGDVVWSAPTPDTSIAPPRAVGLVPGAQYYWYVDALLEDARSSTTGVQEFSIRR